MFLTRTQRIESVREALAKFTAKLNSQDARESIADMIERNGKGGDCEVVVSVKIRPDSKRGGMLVARLDSKLSTRLGAENYFGLTE